ncbi:hypothetical protein P154DRAFT_519765 [Amniculicola lignicola CBS 123094]|uniref:Transmembrane protein n=1 Tax=Amniculicola lignicola CBS 123094 TaxID=1392246 RepID=A0A6A5X197_9PLEO|nr:hypothetical protein P154DRAFT_519765 [Amniculicola lignicola CBS 123094]
MESQSSQDRSTPSSTAFSHPQPRAFTSPSQAQPDGTSLSPKAQNHSTTERSVQHEEVAPNPPATKSYLDRAVQILGVASAITFGIWAPLSWKAAADGNDDNNASQIALGEKLDQLSQISGLRDQAFIAAEYLTSAAAALDDLKNKMDAQGALRLWEFCEGRISDIPACESFISSANVNALITSLAPPFSPSVTPSPTPIPTPTPQPTSTFPPQTSHPKTGAASNIDTKNLVLIILGSVFGGVSLLGMLGLLCMKCSRRKRAARQQTLYPQTAASRGGC